MSCLGASPRVVAIVAGTVSTELGGLGIPAPLSSPDSTSRSIRLSVGNLIGPVFGPDRNCWKAGGLSSSLGISTAKSSGGSLSSVVESRPTSSMRSFPLLLAELVGRVPLAPSNTSSPTVSGAVPRSLVLRIPPFRIPPFQLLLMPRPLPRSSAALPSWSPLAPIDALLPSGSVPSLSSSLAGANILLDFWRAYKSA